uniref:MIF4G domain-containing protein n=3 Tax=Onchocerca TaxID=6281 RepID=A0A2K6VKM1_ONCVO
MESGKCTNTLNGCTRKSPDNNNLLNDVAVTGGAQSALSLSLQRTDSVLSSESVASSQTSTKSPNSTSSRHLHPSGTISPSYHHHHQQQQQHHHHQHRHHNQSQTTTSKQHRKKSGSGGGGGSSNGTSNSPASLLQIEESGDIIGNSGTMQPGTAITGGGNNDNSSSGFNNTTPSRKSTIIGKEHQQHQQSANKKKQLNGKEIEELAAGLRKLNLTKENSLIERFITSNFEDDEIGGAVGQMLVHFSIEENRQAGKVVARIAAQLLNFDTANVFHQGIAVALMHYFECRDRLRIDHFRVWITFLNFVSDLYANVGYIYEGELVDLVFRIFGYLLKAPILDTLKIEELESLIGCLLSVGYDLERQCPEQLAILKDLIRDAFIEVQEPWARKMILLLMELGASGWKLPSEANEYYFQHTSS